MTGLKFTRRRCLVGCFVGVVIIAVVGLGFHWWNRRQPVRPTRIFEGITYGCERLESDAEGSGLMHWVRVDLASPGIELYVTPLDPEAVREGWQYRLRRVGTVVKEENLAVAINGTYFSSNSGWLPMPGDLARIGETIVADHRVGHVAKHSYLLWFGDDLTPRIESSRGPSESVLSQARWGIGLPVVWLRGGKISERGHISEIAARTPADARTAVGIDPQRKLLFLAVFENASPRQALEKLVGLGATDGMLLDGGDSTGMALGAEARGVRPGVLMQGWRPPATHFGVRAKALKR